jgi:hypothetical protein
MNYIREQKKSPLNGTIENVNAHALHKQIAHMYLNWEIVQFMQQYNGLIIELGNGTMGNIKRCFYDNGLMPMYNDLERRKII